VVIIGREFLVSGLRTIASSEGFTLEASDLGKFKTFAQIFCVVAAILNHRWTLWDFGFVVVPVELIARYSIWFMVALSLVSAADYFVAFWSKIDHAFVKRKRRRGFLLSRRRPKSDDVPVT
jgi:CDP-diacylglycerol--glycerol-3-phosphate 3-phosphatidyltransferase